MKLRYADVKAACGKVTNLNSGDSRVLGYVNRACERLLYDAGKSVDTLVRYTCCVESGCIVWPREIETIEAWAQCSMPGTVRNAFYEFVGFGPGQLSADSGPDSGWNRFGSAGQLVDRMNVVAFSEVTGSNKKLAIYADGTESPTPDYVVVRYYDSNGNKVYRTYGSDTIEGERITIPAGGSYNYSLSVVMPGGLYEIIKPVTKRPIRLYEYDTVALTYRALAYYEPDETLPVYRKSMIPCLAENGNCSTSRVTVLGKRRFIPAVDDNSILMISHADAIRIACQAIKKEEDVGISEAEPLWQMAIRCLDRQLKHWQGAGVAAPINFANADCPVWNII